MERIMVFAPHPDDEILSCAGVMAWAVKNRIEVFVVFVTNGDFKGKSEATVRYLESRQALRQLDIPDNRMIFLGFGDTGMEKKDSFIWRLWHSPLKQQQNSFVSDRTYHPYEYEDYSTLRWGFHLPYMKLSLQTVLDDLFLFIKPAQVYCSSCYDAHGDHAALYYFVREALMNCGAKTELFQYVIHGGDDKLWPERNVLHYSRPLLIVDSLWEKRISVPVPVSLDKRGLIQIFESQLSNSGYLISFAKREEIFFTEEINEKTFKNPMA